MPKVKFILENKEIEVESNENLLQAARKANIIIDAPCNGNKSCGKCKVRIASGKVDFSGSIHIKDEEVRSGYVLACGTKIVEDIEVEVPKEASSFMYRMKIDDFKEEREQELLKRAKEQLLQNAMQFKTSIQKEYLEIQLPSLEDNISDLERISRHIRNALGYEKVTCSLSILRKLPETLRNSNFKVTVTYMQKSKGVTELINIEEGNTTDRLIGVAIDIGTTSVSACLVNLCDGAIIAKASMGNAQIKYGADVINRIIFAGKGDGLQKLNHAIIHETINPLISLMMENAKINKDEIVAFVAAGNTTMSHLLLGVYPDYLRRDPYIPAFIKAPAVKASELSLEINPSAEVYLAPSVASYVGGDITAGVLSSGIWNAEENILFIDLGTNGEIVFGNRDFLMTCACSAGPAFEGGEISCGMRASEGAIDSVTIDKDTYEPSMTVIGDSSPSGLCGSGIIDLISEMMIIGIIDRKGRINKKLHTRRIRFDNQGIGEYILMFKEDYGLVKDLSINEVDIDNFIRAKGAIYSGASVLLKSLGMGFEVLDKVYIAGGIGNSLNINSSIRIGMLPDIDEEKFMYIGNSSLMGAYLALMSKDGRHKLEEIANGMTYVELSVYPGYMDEFVSACFLPHTNIEMFPNVRKLLE